MLAHFIVKSLACSYEETKNLLVYNYHYQLTSSLMFFKNRQESDFDNSQNDSSPQNSIWNTLDIDNLAREFGESRFAQHKVRYLVTENLQDSTKQVSLQIDNEKVQNVDHDGDEEKKLVHASQILANEIGFQGNIEYFIYEKIEGNNLEANLFSLESDGLLKRYPELKEKQKQATKAGILMDNFRTDEVNNLLENYSSSQIADILSRSDRSGLVEKYGEANVLKLEKYGETVE